MGFGKGFFDFIVSAKPGCLATAAQDERRARCVLAVSKTIEESDVDTLGIKWASKSSRFGVDILFSMERWK